MSAVMNQQKEGWAWTSSHEMDQIREILRQQEPQVSDLQEVLSRHMRYDGQIQEGVQHGGGRWDISFCAWLAPGQSIRLVVALEQSSPAHVAVYYTGDVKEKWVRNMLADFQQALEAHFYR